MELQEALLKRRSVRKFTEEAVSKEDIDVLMHAAMSGPSAMNLQPWEFYVVTNPEKLELLRQTTPYTKMKAPLAIVAAGNLKRSIPLHRADFWTQDVSAATENILLAVTDLGLGAVWCGVYPNEKPVEHVREVLGMPEKSVPLNIIFVGHPAEEPAARDQYHEKCVHYI